MSKVFGTEIPISFLKKEEGNYTQAEEYFNEYIENLEECSKVDDYNCICGEMPNFPATLPDKYYINIKNLNGQGKKINLTFYYDAGKKEQKEISSGELEKISIFINSIRLFSENNQEKITLMHNPREYILDKYKQFGKPIAEIVDEKTGQVMTVYESFSEKHKIYFEEDKKFLPQYPTYIYEVEDAEIKKADKTQDLSIIFKYVLKEEDNSLKYFGYKETSYDNDKTELNFNIKHLQLLLGHLPLCEDGRQKAIEQFLEIKQKIDLGSTAEVKVELPQGGYIEAKPSEIRLIKNKKVTNYYLIKDIFFEIKEAELKKEGILCEGQEEFDIFNGRTIYIKKGCLSLEG